MLVRLVDRWLSRNATPENGALEAVAHLKPMVVVTGGSRGIGLELGRRFAKAGRAVALIARDAATLELQAAAIKRDCHVHCAVIAQDITEADAAERIEASLTADGYYVDVLINCAGIGLAGPFVSHTEAQIDELLRVNVMALTNLTRHTLPQMLARGRGGIMNVASVGGLVPGPNQAAYYASKAYVVSLTRALATENAGRGVRIMALAPGPVDTGFHQAMGAELSFYRQLLVALSARQTARAGYRAYLAGCHLFVPGITGKFLQVALWIIPHAVLLPIIGWLLRRRDERPWRDTSDKEA
ncbi:SDR family oxidoreductase [Hyphomicrobium sp. D-2]|uniref:SDR family NAD(P)-dependent oxidoreductase n=1 Tax=Hyphomicrobium sp. D-2 TaxID=3041621 RepID=UPI00245812F4|nr:SDR family oxidoreductase [Hyphomicrobium sp. D-2]MDH4983285.1 SDR family oxidoreductase [Hyphomicrobium sp. D-2]